MYKKLIALTIAFSLIFPAAIFAAPNSSSSSSSPSTSSRSGSFSNSPSRPSAPSVAPKPVPAPAAPAQNSVTGSTSGTFSGSSSTKPNVPTAPNPTNKPSTTTPSNDKSSTYNSGFSKPTVQVTNGSRTNPYSGTAYRGGGAYYNAPPVGVGVSSFGTHMTMFAAGTMLGTMMHPWGGYYGIPGGVGVVHQPFSFLYALLDLAVFALIAGIIIYAVVRYRRSKGDY